MRSWRVRIGPGEVYLAESRFPSGLTLTRHCHPSAIYCLVLEGRFTEQYRRRTRRANPLDTVYYTPQADHSGVFEEGPVRLLTLGMAGNWTKDLPGRVREEPEAKILNARGSRLLLSIYRLFLRVPEAGGRIEFQELVCMLSELGSSRPGCGHRPDWIDLVHERFSDDFIAPPDLATAAREVSVHPCHLARTFRRHFGFTIGELVRRRRVARVIQLLRTSLPLAEIALDSGFSDQSHMGREFKRGTGFTPAEYRNLCG